MVVPKTMDIAIDKMKFEACCNFKCEHDEKLNEIKESVVEMKMSSGKQMEEGKKQVSRPGKSGESDVLNQPDI